MDKKLFQGSGGGGPTSTPDSLLAEDVVEFALAVSEGPIRGLSKGAYSFMVGDTPLVSADGTRAFDKFAIGVYPGYPEGSATPIDLKLGGTSSNYSVNVNLLQNTPVIRTTDAQLRGNIDRLEVRLVFNSLVNVSDDGSTKTNTAHFKIEYKPASSGTWKMFNGGSEMTTTGKTSGGYPKEFWAPVPDLPNDDWTIRVTKLSPDNDAHNVVNMAWESYQAVTLSAATYPDTAIVHGIGVANGQFSSIPDFSGVYDGLVIRVPTNYNPDTRTYDESTPWNGSFKLAWTNNPAWILYDLIVNTRYGLAAHRRYIDANRFSFYEAAKWCDQPVAIKDSNDTRPRYTFNMVLTDQTQGMELLNYVAGSFNALVWDDLQGQIHLRVDKDDPAVMMFTPENVTEDGFNYTFTDITTRVNDISVGFVNPDLDWNEDKRRIPGVTTNEDHIAKFGRTTLDFIAVGCTNLEEAIAKAQVRLVSSLTETTMVNFTTTALGSLLSLYDVILVADPFMGWSQSGRITSYDSQWLNFRDPIYIETMQTYVLKLQTPTSILELNVTPEAPGSVKRLRLQTAIPQDAYVPRYATFTLEGTEGGFGYAKPFRVMGIAESEDSPYMYVVNAVEINRSKYSIAEGEPTDIGNEFDYSTKVPYLPGAPYDFTADSGDTTVQVLPTGEVISRIYTSWQKPYSSVVSSYILQYRLSTGGDTDWETIPTSATSAYIAPVSAGQSYSLRVAALDASNNQSGWVVIDNYVAKGKLHAPAKLASVTAKGGLFQNTLNWDFGAAAPDLAKVEIWAATSDNQNSASKLTDLSYPTSSWVHVGLSAGTTVFYWLRVLDTSGNPSPWSDKVSATASSDASQVLALLQGQITSSQLFKDLSSRIDLIDGPASLAGSVNARVKTVSDVVNDPNTGLAAATAAITKLNDVSATSTSANAKTLYQLKAQVNDAATGLPAATAAITQLNNVSATSTSASAKAIYQVTSRLNSAGGTGVTIEQAFQTQALALEGLSGQYTIKIDNNGYVAGFGLSSSSGPDGNTSAFIIYADAFGVVMPGHSGLQPFTIGTVNGVPQVVLSNALIGDASISSAMIGDAQINTLKLAGEAVTVPVSVNCYKAAPGKGRYNFYVITEGYFQMSDPGILYALFTGAATFPTGDRQWSLKMRINGIDRQVIGGAKFNDAPSLSSSCAVPAGVSHVEVLWYADNDRTQILTSTLFMIATKK